MNFNDINLKFGKDLNKAFLVCVLFLIIFTFIPPAWHYIGDFDFHFEKLKGCDNHPDKEACEVYFPLLHFFGSVFSFSQLAFSRFLMIILVFITPLILYFTTKNWIVTWFYFSTTQYVYIIQGGAAYPQALAGIMLLLLFATKNNWFRSVILIVSILTHSQAFPLIGISWLVLLFFENFSAKNVFPACSALFGRTESDPIGQKVQVDLVSVSGKVQQYGIQLKDLGNFFIRTFPFPFLLAAFWQLWKEKNFAPIVLSVIFFYVSLVSNPRVLIMIPLILLPPLTKFYSGLEGWWKKGFIGLTILSFLWLFGTWLLFKVNCIAT